MNKLNKIFLLFLFNFIIINIFGQKIIINDIKTIDYPAIEIFVTSKKGFELNKQNTKIFEKNISIDFVIDSVNIKENYHNNIILLVFDIQYVDNLNSFVDEILQSINLLENTDKLNISFSENSKSENQLNILSPEFSNDFDFFKNLISKEYFQIYENSEQINNEYLFEIIDYMINKELFSSKKKVIIITDKKMSENKNFDEYLVKSLKNNISINFILLKSDTTQEAEIENLIADKTNGFLFQTSDYNFFNYMEKIVNKQFNLQQNEYKITLIVSENLLFNDLVFDFDGNILEKRVEKPENSSKSFQQIIWGILILAILIISYLLFISKLKIKNLFKLNSNQIIEELRIKNKELEDKIAKYKSNKSFFIPDFKDFNPSLTIFGGGGEIPVIMIKNKDISNVFEISKHLIMIGRTSENDLVINDLAISSRHATLNNEGGEFYIIDNDSTNGVFVNDIKVSKSKISVNDIVRIGNTYLKLKF